MAFKNEYEESFAYAASSCSNLVARYLQKNNGMTANYNQREARLELVSWSKELFSVEKDGRELVDPYTDFLFKHYDEYIDDFEDRNVENYLNRYLEEIRFKFSNNEHVVCG